MHLRRVIAVFAQLFIGLKTDCSHNFMLKNEAAIKKEAIFSDSLFWKKYQKF